ncbi:MAG: flippase-like domain-containing protein, partial [Methanothermobacter sp.]
MKQFYVLILSIVLLLLLIIWIGPFNILKALETADWWFILLAAIIHLVVVWIRSLRWGFIIDQTREFKKNFIVKTIGIFAGNFSPMKSAGEVLNAVAGKNINQISLSEGLSAGLTERFFDLAIAGSLLIIAGLFLPKIRLIAILGGALSLTIMFVVYLINWREGSGVWLYDKIHPLISKLPIREEVLDNLYDKLINGLQGMIGYANSFSNFKNLSFVFILSLLSWLLECVRLYVVFYAFHVEIDFVAIIIIFLLANVIGVISALPGGIGSIEISLTGLFVLFGVPSAMA